MSPSPSYLGIASKMACTIFELDNVDFLLADDLRSSSDELELLSPSSQLDSVFGSSFVVASCGAVGHDIVGCLLSLLSNSSRRVKSNPPCRLANISCILSSVT